MVMRLYRRGVAEPGLSRPIGHSHFAYRTPAGCGSQPAGGRDSIRIWNDWLPGGLRQSWCCLYSPRSRAFRGAAGARAKLPLPTEPRRRRMRHSARWT
jgi:hypothetical protein